MKLNLLYYVHFLVLYKPLTIDVNSNVPPTSITLQGLNTKSICLNLTDLGLVSTEKKRVINYLLGLKPEVYKRDLIDKYTQDFCCIFNFPQIHG